MYFLFLPALCGKEYYSYPALQGKNNIPARRVVREFVFRCQTGKITDRSVNGKSLVNVTNHRLETIRAITDFILLC